MRMTRAYYATLVVCDGSLTHCDVSVEVRELDIRVQFFVLLFLAEELDAFVDFNVLLATNVRGLELVV